MAGVVVKAWRGVLRGNLKVAARVLNSLLEYRFKHPEVGLFTDAEVITINNCQALVSRKLADTKVR